jgi:hypothetical protein
MAGKHDKLQSLCFKYIHNELGLRYLCHANINSHPLWKAREISVLKGTGLVKGVLDLEFYYQGVLHVFDIKIGSDRLKKEQLEYIKAIEAQGGKGYEIRSFEQFKEIVDEVVRDN